MCARGPPSHHGKASVWLLMSVYVLVTVIKKRIGIDASLYALLQVLSVTPFRENAIAARLRDRSIDRKSAQSIQPTDSVWFLARDYLSGLARIFHQDRSAARPEGALSLVSDVNEQPELPMPKCTEGRIEFGRVGRRIIEANFDGGDLSSDGGLMLLRRVDERIGLSRAGAAALDDARDPSRITHSLRDLIAQRLYALCCGYEDLNDHDALRADLLMQTAVGRVEPLASAPTLCRLEARATGEQAAALHAVLVDQFIASFDVPPAELVLDIDASDVPLHGQQERSGFHAYYDHHCYLPLYVFCGQVMLACYLRRSRIDGAKNATALIKVLIQRLRQVWPGVGLIVRGDSGFCRQRLLRWCERANVRYIVGLARNGRLEAQVQYAELMLAEDYARTLTKQRLIGEFAYAADSWDIERRVITRLEYGVQGTNPRFVVTNLDGAASDLYERLYCARGEAENRIKEAQLDLFGTRASCHRFAANQLRLLLAALAYTLMQRLRELALAGSELERASAATIRWRLLKIGAAIVRNTRRLRILLASHHPLRALFFTAVQALAP